MTDPGAFETLVVQLHEVLEHGKTDLLAEIVSPDVIWGDCMDREQVVAFVESAVSGGLVATDVDVEAAEDRLIARLSFGSGDEAHRSFMAVFVEEGKIAQVVDAASHEEARSIRPVATGSGDRSAMNSVAPVFPVADVTRALQHYEALGFEVHAYEGPAAYGYAVRGEVQLHVARVNDLDPKTNTSAAYLYVEDADSLFMEWRAADAGGRLVAPQDTDYGIREGAHIDEDGNLLRFGSPLEPGD